MAADDDGDLDGVEIVREPARFVAHVEGRTAELIFGRTHGRLLIVHVEVPDVIERRGVGGALVRTAVEWAVSEGLVVVPRCPFAHAWLCEHPEVAQTASIDWE